MQETKEYFFKDILGFEEFKNSKKRNHKIEAVQDSRLYFIYRDDYERITDNFNINIIKENSISRNKPLLNCLTDLPIKEYIAKSKVYIDEKQVNAFLDAIRLNLPNEGYDNGRLDIATSRRQKRLLPWLNK